MQPLRVSVKAIIIRDNRILLIRNRNDQGDWFALPGGGANHGEPLDEALKRECSEEIGCLVRVGRLLFVRDYIGRNHEFAETDGEAHQVEVMFECEIADSEHSKNKAPGLGPVPDSMQTGVDWIDLKELHALNFYPHALIEHLHVATLPANALYLGDVN